MNISDEVVEAAGEWAIVRVGDGPDAKQVGPFFWSSREACQRFIDECCVQPATLEPRRRDGKKGGSLDPTPADQAMSRVWVHDYAAAGFVVCGRETGGAISRRDGYVGPRIKTTTTPAEVTCPDCIKENADD